MNTDTEPIPNPDVAATHVGLEKGAQTYFNHDKLIR